MSEITQEMMEKVGHLRTAIRLYQRNMNVYVDLANKLMILAEFDATCDSEEIKKLVRAAFTEVKQNLVDINHTLGKLGRQV